MESDLDSLRRPRGTRGWTMRVAVALIVCIAFAVAGCGSKEKRPAAASQEESGASGKVGRPEAGARGVSAKGPRIQVAPVGGHVRLVDRGCIAFEPHWSTIQLGQSLTWHSELKTKVTIHVPAGAFDHVVYVVQPKGTTSSGPARDVGDHPMWCIPAACQAAPHGVQGAGPGVTIAGGP